MAVTNKRKRKWWSLPLTLLIIVLVAAGAFFTYRYVNAKNASGAASNLTTVRVTLGSLQATVGASGNVYANQTTTIQWKTAGRIGTINVKQGDKVKAGQVLATLDPTSLTDNNVILAKQNLITAQQNLQNLQDSTVSQANAMLALTQAQQAVTDAQTGRDLLNYSRGQNGNADAAWAQLYIAQDTYNKALDRYNKLQNLAPTDPARANATTALVNAQQAMQQKQAIVDWYTGGPTANDIAQADANLAVAKAKLADAQRTYDQVKNGPSASDLASAQAQVDAAQAVLNETQITAPFDGTVTILYGKVGDLVSNNTNFARVDDLSTMFVDLSISEVDIAKVKTNQKVTINFDAVPTKTYNGFVHDIDGAGTISSGAVNYLVTVQLTDADTAIAPAMTASANVVLDQVADVLTVPSRGVRVSNGQYYVLVLRNGAIQQVNVKLGLSSDTEVEVISNQLQNGDIVVTNPLSQLTGNNGGGFGGGIRIPGVGGGATGGFGGGGGNFNGGRTGGGTGGTGGARGGTGTGGD
ncbi:MAG TPA: efflux RND transporter periplasmic adaptor subunit [Anaerolineaceae bacterium]|nr:efflux RND transporter periplasmic adaptor subunit [Anaerolineaceae bacterium]